MPEESDSYTLVIIHPRAAMVLTNCADGLKTLPSIRVPAYSRVADEVTKAIAEQWGLSAFVLFQPDVLDPSLVLILSEQSSLPRSLTWAPLSDFANDALPAAAVRQLLKYEDGSIPGVFARRAAIDELRTWVSECVRPFGLRLTRTIKQFNSGPSNSLFRFETDAIALWFKATGEPHRHEFSVTRLLTSHLPECLPKIIAFHENWNGWLAYEAEGVPINICGSRQGWLNAANSLAKIQLAFLGDTELLRNGGCRDRSLNWIRSNIPAFFDRAEIWMRNQPSATRSQPLSPEALRELRERIVEIVEELSGLQIPETVVHGDLNPQNVVVSAANCVFLDWAEAWLSHPFIGYQYLRELLQRTHPERLDWMNEARELYVSPWLKEFDARVVRKSLTLSCPIAVLVRALIGSETYYRLESHHVHIERVLRTLVRRLDREVRALKEAVA